MLPALPNPLVQFWFDGWRRRALRRHFRRVHLYFESPEERRTFDPGVPRLYVANHTSFWDGIVLSELLGRRRRQPAYSMIDAVQIREHPFFRRIGGFSVDRTRPRDAMRAIDYAAGLLSAAPENQSKTARRPAVVIFPQGSIRPNDERPLRFESGAARLARRAPAARVVPVALRYEFWVDQRPQAMIWIGRERSYTGLDRWRIAADLESSVAAGLDRLRGHGLRFEPGDEILLEGQPSIADWKQTLRAKLGLKRRA